METVDVRAQALDVIAEAVRVDRALLTDGASLRELGLTSIDLVEVIFRLEEHFGVSFPYDGPALDGQTLGDLLRRVEELVRARPA